MSSPDVFTATADDIVRVLKESPHTGGVSIIADFQQDLTGEMRKVATRAVGNLILVTDSGGENKDLVADKLRLNHVFTVTLWSPEFLAPGSSATPANQLKQAICQVLHNYRPKVHGVEKHMQDRWIVMGCVRIEAPAGLPLLVHRIPVQIPVQLPKL